jgi:hypothetical protein
VDFFSCTNGAPGNGFPCFSSAGQAAANFTPNQVTFNWTGLNIAPGTTLDTTFASWNNSAFALPGPIAAAGLPGFIFSERCPSRLVATAAEDCLNISRAT